MCAAEQVFKPLVHVIPSGVKMTSRCSLLLDQPQSTASLLITCLSGMLCRYNLKHFQDFTNLPCRYGEDNFVQPLNEPLSMGYKATLYLICFLYRITQREYPEIDTKCHKANQYSPLLEPFLYNSLPGAKQCLLVTSSGDCWRIVTLEVLGDSCDYY